MGLSAGQDTAELHGGGGMPDTETGLFTKKKGMNKNEKGNMEINSADHRDCTHCTLHITRSYELHVVHVETKLFTKKTI